MTGILNNMPPQQSPAPGLRKATANGGISIQTAHTQKTAGNISTAIGITLMPADICRQAGRKSIMSGTISTVTAFVRLVGKK